MSKRFTASNGWEVSRLDDGQTMLRKNRGTRDEITWCGGDVYDAIAEYVVAHRGASEPRKPWLAAKPGEVWELTIYGEKRAHVMQSSGRFLATDSPLSTPGNCYDISAGRRIYPEVDNV